MTVMVVIVTTITFLTKAHVALEDEKEQPFLLRLSATWLCMNGQFLPLVSQSLSVAA